LATTPSVSIPAGRISAGFPAAGCFYAGKSTDGLVVDDRSILALRTFQTDLPRC
jgi:hypothetical protein